jgi:rhomboid family GlyGly-CTERM serine protease
MGQTANQERASSGWRLWSLPLSLALLALFAALMGEGATEALRYQRSGILAGEWWRLLSGHFVHLGWSHLWLNLAGLLLVWGLVGRAFSTAHWWGVIVTSLLGISCGLWWWLPQLAWYVGLSGLLHGMLMAGSLRLALASEREARFLVIMVAAKVAWELWQGPLPGSREAAGGEVVVEAHALGCLCGAIYVAAQRLVVRWRPPKA